MIPVTKPYVPSRKIFDQYVDKIFDTRLFSNNGPLVSELTQKLEKYLGVENLLLVNNGTLALEVAIQALGLGEGDEAITSPFTYVATSSAIKRMGVEPIYSDIDNDDWCLNPDLLSSKFSNRTKAIVPVHVFGNVCDVDALEKLAQERNVKLLFDASHCFSTKYNGTSILNYGDASTLSFHATKLFHTGEGGAIVFKQRKHYEIAKQIIEFGYDQNREISLVGTNAKMSELNAALGLSILNEFDQLFSCRKTIWVNYQENLKDSLIRQKLKDSLAYNYAYFPVLFQNQNKLLKCMEELNKSNIFARRYFYPSLSDVDLFSQSNGLSTSTNISRRIMCLPLYHGLEIVDQNKIIEIINRMA